MIELCGVSKRFGRYTAVHPLDLHVPQGALWGLLGHNGAGKSTLIGMMLGQIFPDQGLVKMDGEDVIEKRTRALVRVGAIYETPGFYSYLSGLTNLRIFTAFTGPMDEERLWEVIRLVGMERAIHKMVGTYSSGMRQRLALAQALLPDPALLILDEPATGLDPEGFHDLREILRKLHKEHQLTILLSSHLLAEVEQLCTHVTIINRGHLLFSGAWSLPEQQLLEIQTSQQEAMERAALAAGVVAAFEGPGLARLTAGTQAEDLAAWAVQQGFRLRLLRPRSYSLEQFYMSQTQEKDTHPS